ncbi:WYL domain-containing protein [Desulforamulus putei]|uniref:Helix-turn-helix domain-containing protein n=1 Tax=Desulforamulus putei DSM 12395 TaxID=1121429 RepID=A0A1M4ZW05_9FIRM|nr:WYL domain-containing protein [Desulforamulus putei]SHF22198.1 Helix-turn-helix domain-containing protein [Desulforamulus putei DSM 12395]
MSNISAIHNNGVMVLDKKRFKKVKHNHTRNLEIVLKELRQHSEQGGVTLEYLALQCGVSTRQIYRYLNELQSLGYEILKTVPRDSECSGGYTLKEMELDQHRELPLLNMLDDLERLKSQITLAKMFIKELLVRLWMNKLGMVLPLTIPILAFDHDDAVTLSRQTLVFSNTTEGVCEDIKIRVSAKVISSVTQSLAAEIISKQKQKDGWFNVQIKTGRVREMAGLLTQWGGEIEVIEPGWLRHRMLENCKSILHANRLRKIDKTNLYSPAGKYLVSY